MFSDKFKVSREAIEEYGAINISLIADIPLFVDPILIFNSEKPEYQRLHNRIIEYLYFLARKAEKGLNKSEIKTWFSFNEVCNNWLGYSKNGNKGLALDVHFAQFLYENISFVIGDNNICKGKHIEKIMLLKPGSGKDKISDLTVNLIKGFLCEYTETFAKKYINDNSLAMNISVDKAEFNYETECFVSKEYYLPYIINEKGKIEYVLLTPSDILRRDEQSINLDDFRNNYKMIRDSIENDILRVQVDNYLQKAVNNYHLKCTTLNIKAKYSEEEREKKNAFEDFAKEHTEIYDYYIKMKEMQHKDIVRNAKEEVEDVIEKFVNIASKLAEIINDSYVTKNRKNSLEESIDRVKYLKDVIENQGLYNIFYESKDSGEPRFSSEKDIQLLFKFAWYNSRFKLDAETNNGDGPADFVVSFGKNDVTVIEFKLASNSRLGHVFKQVEVYEKANSTNQRVIVIFYFNDKELQRANKEIEKEKKISEINKSIFLIDCRNRESASKR